MQRNVVHMFDLATSHPQLRTAYREALRCGIPSSVQTGDLFDRVEVKTAMALLRCVVNPAAAGGVMVRRLITKNEIKCPVTAGLGEVQD